MRPPPHVLLRGLLKFLAVALAAGVVGVGLGVALAELSGDDESPSVAPQATSSPTTTTQTSPRAASTQTAPSDATPTSTSTTTTRSTTTSTTSSDEPNRTTRVQVLSAVLFPAATADGQARRRARLVVRVRLTSRATETIAAQVPRLIVGAGRIRPDRNGARADDPLLKPLTPAKSVTGELNFETTGVVTQFLTSRSSARLNIAGRTVAVNIRISDTPAPAPAE